MKTAVIYGDLSSDSTSDQYPTVTLCEACIRQDQALEERSQIVAIEGDAGPDDGPCEWCDEESD